MSETANVHFNETRIEMLDESASVFLPGKNTLNQMFANNVAVTTWITSDHFSKFYHKKIPYNGQL